MQLVSAALSALLLSTAAAGAFELRSAAHLLTPLDLVTLPRLSPSLPNPSGSHVLHTVSVQGNSTVYLSSLLDPLGSAPFPVLSQPHAGLVWLADDELAFLDEAGTSLSVVSLDLSLAPHAIALSPAREVLSFPAPVGDLTFHPASGVLAFTAWVHADGNLSTVRDQDARWAERGDDGQVYDSLFVRHWDSWRGPKVSQIFTVDLARGKHAGWAPTGAIRAPVNATGLASPSPDALSSFALSATHLAVSAKHPLLSPATHTRRPVYLVPLHAHEGEGVRELTAGDRGATSNVRFSPDESRVAWLEMAEDGYEADRNRLVVFDLATAARAEFAQGWDTARAAFEWTSDAAVVLVASEHAHEQLYTLPVPRKPTAADLARKPKAVYSRHSSSSPAVVRPGKHANATRVVFTRSSMSYPPEAFVLALPAAAAEVDDDDFAALVDARSVTNFTAGQMKDKRLEEPESFYFTGAEGVQVQGWAVKPVGFKKGHKYPLAFLIHGQSSSSFARSLAPLSRRTVLTLRLSPAGGPQGAWEDSFSLRWAPQVFASQGFFTIAINPTGSTSFGQAFTDDIQSDWGGRPFRDLLAGFEHALDRWPEIDRERTAALGASYGGFMINWIQGHNDQFNFACLTAHDGIASTLDAYFVHPPSLLSSLVRLLPPPPLR